MRWRVLGIATAAAFCAFLAACGSGSDGPTVVTVAIEDRPPTKAEFIRKADSICLKYNRKIEHLNDELSDAKDVAASSGDTEEVAAIYREVIPLLEAGAEDLRALTPPPADTAIYNGYLRSAEQQIPLLERLAGAIDADDIEEIEDSSVEIKTTVATSNGIAKGYGFKSCGGG